MLIYVLILALNYFVNAILFLIFVSCLISWLPVNRNNKIIQLIYLVTEPILSPVRRLVAKSPLGGPGMMIDFSPLIACLVIYFLRDLIVWLLLMIQ